MGDSWAMGEWSWQSGHYHTQTQGMADLLRKAGYQVQNWARSGTGNLSQCRRVQPHLEQVDRIIWVLTDPLRDLEPWPSRMTLTEYHQHREHLLWQALREAQSWHLPVLVIGGVCAVPEAWLTESGSVQVCCADWRRWLIPDVPGLDILCRGWPYPTPDPALLHLWEQQERDLARHLVRAQHHTQSLEHLYFWPDGLHPNQRAHERLVTELILPQITG